MPRDYPVLASILPEHGILAKIQTFTNVTFAGRSSRPDHLECGATVDSLARAFDSGLTDNDKRSTTIVIEKLHLSVLRSDAGPAHGGHWAILAQVGGHFVLLDLTHLQFDLPRSIDHAAPDLIRAADGGRYALTLGSARPEVIRGRSRQEVLDEWRNFVLRKPYVTAVRNVVVYPKSMNAASGTMERTGSS